MDQNWNYSIGRNHKVIVGEHKTYKNIKIRLFYFVFLVF